MVVIELWVLNVSQITFYHNYDIMLPAHIGNFVLQACVGGAHYGFL